MNNLISITNNFNLVIYTDEKSSVFINTYNKPNIKVIIKPIECFITYRFKHNWILNHQKNNMLNHNSFTSFNTSWELNMLWSEKISFVKDAYENKYFDTKWYGWCDIGYFRWGNNLTPKEISKWPSKDKINLLDKNKIYYGRPGNNKSLNMLFKIIMNKNKNNMPIIPIPPEQESIDGGFFLSHKDKIEWWNTTYYNRLNDYFNYEYLVKDDQIIIIDCIINNLTNFKLIEEQNPLKDRWFVFQSFLL
jgi:hypothetical protein